MRTLQKGFIISFFVLAIGLTSQKFTDAAWQAVAWDLLKTGAIETGKVLLENFYKPYCKIYE